MVRKELLSSKVDKQRVLKQGNILLLLGITDLVAVVVYVIGVIVSCSQQILLILLFVAYA